MKNIHIKNLGLGFFHIMNYLYIIPFILAFLFRIFFPDFVSSHNDYAVLIISMLIYIITIIYLLYMNRDTVFKELKYYFHNFPKNFGESFLTWLKGFVFMILANLIVIRFTGDIASNEATNRSIIAMYPMYSVFAMIILGPFIEELLFRKNFKNALKNKQLFCIVTALLFGLAHVYQFLDFTTFETFLQTAPQLLFLIPYGGIGHIYAQSYYDTNNIFVSTGAHIIQNTVSVLTIMIGV